MRVGPEAGLGARGAAWTGQCRRRFRVRTKPGRGLGGGGEFSAAAPPGEGRRCAAGRPMPAVGMGGQGRHPCLRNLPACTGKSRRRARCVPVQSRAAPASAAPPGGSDTAPYTAPPGVGGGGAPRIVAAPDGCEAGCRDARGRGTSTLRSRRPPDALPRGVRFFHLHRVVAEQGCVIPGATLDGSAARFDGARREPGMRTDAFFEWRCYCWPAAPACARAAVALRTRAAASSSV